MASETARSAVRENAMRCFQAGDYNNSALLLDAILSENPEDPVLFRLHGMALVRTGRALEALPSLAHAVKLAPQDAICAVWHGIGLQAAQRYSDAARMLQAGAALAPDDPAPLIHLSRAFLKLDRPADALAAARRAVTLAPLLLDAKHAEALSSLAFMQSSPQTSPADLAAAWLALGRTSMRLDKVLDARTALLEALRALPLYAEAECELSLVEHLCGQPVAAVTRLRAVLQRDPDCHLASVVLASRLLLDDDAAAALAVLDGAAAELPDELRAQWHAQRAQALIALGRNEAASRELASAEKRGVRELDLLLAWQRFVLARRTAKPNAIELGDLVTRLTTIREAGLLEHRIDAHFDIAELRHDEGDRAAAFGHWRRGHELLANAQPFSRQQHVEHLAAITHGFNAARLADGARAAGRDEVPVFIVGLPRTGTTLLEQILSAHPEVHGGGERLAVRETLARLTGTFAASKAVTRAAVLDESALTAASAEYLAELHALSPNASRVLDKMPDNLFQLGFIATLLPGARVICCTRDLRDVGASIFQHRFVGHHPYAHDLADLGWYMAGQQKLIEHWRVSLPLPILMLDHAEWLKDFDATLRRVLSFLALPYDAACERFFELDRRVGSASRVQVRRPINAAGVGRWLLYAEQLAPMLRELP